MMDTVIYFVRHGQSVGNLKQRLLGFMDLELSELGYRQAEISADALADVEFDKIYSSDLQRAYYTALAHAKRRGLEVEVDKRLREMFLGEMEYADMVQLKNDNDPDIMTFYNDFGNFHPKGGESTVQLAERIYEATLDIAKKNVGKTILIGCHGAAIRVLFGKLLGYTREEVSKKINFPLNASVSVVRYNGEDLIPVEFSRDEHIVDTLPLPSQHKIFC